MTRHPTPLERFRNRLDAFGADLDRWPDADRREAADLIAREPAARALHREARALDRALAAAPLVPPSEHARIAGAIMAALSRPTPAAQPEPVSARIIPLPPRHRVEPHRSGASSPPRRQLWQVAASLAASLVMGVLIGLVDVAEQPLRGLLETAGIETEISQLMATLSGDSLTPPPDEDQL
jgi:hypothetical protein